MQEVKRFEDYPEPTRAFMKFVARETGHSVEEVVSWQQASNSSPAQVKGDKKSGAAVARA